MTTNCWTPFSLAIVTLLALFAAPGLARTVQDPAQTPAQTPAAVPATEQTAEEAKADAELNQIFVTAMADLVPGELKSGSPLETALKNSVDSFRRKQFGDAHKFLKTYKEANPKFPPADLILAGLYFSATRIDEGFLLLESAAKSEPDYPGTYLAFGRMALNQRRFTDSRALLEKAKRKIEQGSFDEIEKKHFQSQLYETITLVSLRQGRNEDAKKMAKVFADLEGTTVKSLTVGAEVSFRNKDLPKCIQQLEQLKTLNKATRIPELIVATWYGQLNEVKNASKWIEIASKKYPDDMKVQMEYATFLVSSEKFELAAPLIERIETSEKETSSTTSLKAKIAFAQRDYGTAEVEYRKLYDKNPTNFDVANMYAMSLIESPFKEKKEVAKKLTVRNFKAVPDNQVAQSALGWVYYRTGELRGAKQLFARAAQSTQMPPEVAYFLSKFLAEAEDFERAEKLLSEALEHEGLYLYRASAAELLREVQAKIQEETGTAKAAEKENEGTLPNPGK